MTQCVILLLGYTVVPFYGVHLAIADIWVIADNICGPFVQYSGHFFGPVGVRYWEVLLCIHVTHTCSLSTWGHYHCVCLLWRVVVLFFRFLWVSIHIVQNTVENEKLATTTTTHKNHDNNNRQQQQHQQHQQQQQTTTAEAIQAQAHTNTERSTQTKTRD